MNLFLMGPNVTNNMAICDLDALGDFVIVDEKQVLVTWMSPIPWKSRSVLLDMPFAPFQFIGAFCEILVLLGLAHFGADDCVCHYWLKGKVTSC